MRLISLIIVIQGLAAQKCNAQAFATGDSGSKAGIQQFIADSSTKTLQDVPLKYVTSLDQKAEKYTARISSKTEKTLTRLAKWEAKVHTVLQKADPAADAKLFGSGKPTFANMLQKMKDGEALQDEYRAQYDCYRDKVTVNVEYLTEKEDSLSAKFIKPLAKARTAIETMDSTEAQSEVAENLIKERKKDLIDAALKYPGTANCLKKINKESFYYSESLRDLKTAFSDPAGAEQAGMEILNRIPGFKRFAAKNSLFSRLFGSSSLPNAGGSTMTVINGIAPRSRIMQVVQKLGASQGSADIFSTLNAQMPDIKSKMTAALNKETPDEQTPPFKYNSQHTKSLFKRLEYGSDIQFQSASAAKPLTAQIGMEAGYKIDDTKSAGVGVSYLLGLGHGWQKMHLSNEGLGLRSYLKFLLKKGFSVRGGSEWNYNFHFSKLADLKNNSSWQQSALLGAGKTYSAGKKMKGEIKLFYDFLYNRHTPATQPFVFRMGYHF